MPEATVELVAPPATSKRVDHQKLHAHLLRTARHTIWELGYEELTMSRLAEAAGCARKTVYNHFSNIEEVVLALCIQSTTRRAELVARAAMFRGRPRERILAIGRVMEQVLPFHMRHEVLLCSISSERTAPERQRQLRFQEERILSVIAGVIRDAVAVGDLELPAHLSPESLALSLYQQYLGAHAVARRGFALGTHSLEESMRAMRLMARTLLDDLGWRPHSSDMDIPATVPRILREVFPDLVQRFDVSV